MKKNLIGKFATIALGAAVLLNLAPTALAAAQFNTYPGDKPTLQVGNASQNAPSNGAWSTSVNVNAGEVLNFLVFYHNAGDTTATNTRLKINLPTSIGSTATATGFVASDNSSQVNGSATAILNGGGTQTLTYVPGSARWYTSQAATGIVTYIDTFPSGQTGDEAVNSASGVNIGSVPVHGSGFLQIRVQVGTTIQQNPVNGNAPLVNACAVSVLSPNSVTFSTSVNPNNSFTTVRFDYGTSTSFGNTTTTTNINSGSSYIAVSATASNLVPSSFYYCRVVASNSFGTNASSTANFSTGSTNTNTVVSNNTDLSGIQSSLSQLSLALSGLIGRLGNSNNSSTNNTTVIRTVVASVGSSLAKLTISADKTALTANDKVVITVQVDPLGDITKAILQVKLDPFLVFESTTASSFTKTENTITYNLGSVPAGTTQIVRITAHLSNDFSSSTNNSKVTTTATLNYSDANGSAMTPLFSSLDVNVGNSGLFASIFGAFGWGSGLTILLIALLILLIAVAVRRLMV